MPSKRFSVLQGRIKELKRLLLPSRFDPTGSYKDPLRITTRALSFRVLAHAEVETYLEDRVLEIATAALKAWEDKQFVSPATLHLLAFSGRSFDRPPETLRPPDEQKAKDWPSRISINDRFSKCISEFHKRVRTENHGVKEKHILDLLLPVGFDVSKCDVLFLQTMNNFGEARGAVAHTSGKSHIQKAVDPKDELNILHEILASLVSVDLELDRVLQAASAGN